MSEGAEGSTCAQCGAPLRSGLRFCTSCSAPLTRTAVGERNAQTGPLPNVVLVVEIGPTNALIWTATPVVIGRSKTAGLVLDDPYVSSRHARVTLREDTALLEDLGSTNGTFLNGTTVHGPTEVRPGDRIAIGDCILILQHATSAPSD